MFIAQTRGQGFEDLCHEKMIELYGSDGYRIASRHEDLYEGTDGFIYGLRVDFTLKGGDKSNYKPIGLIQIGPIESPHYTVTVGVRTGNCFCEFSEPVMVLDFNLFIPAHKAKALLDLVEQAHIDAAMDLFWQHVD